MIAPAREIRYAASGRANIAYTVVGSGDVDVVFVPGFVSHLEVFWEEPAAAGFLAGLAAFARVLLWDKREQGLSDRIGGAPTLEESQDDLLAVMDAAGVERAAVIGVSEGGPLSIVFAAAHPERTSSLVLYGSTARIPRADDYPEGLSERLVRATIDRLVDGWGGAPCLDLWAPSRAGDPEFAAWWARLLRSATSPGSVRANMELVFEMDVRDVLPAVRAPTLVLHSTHDALLPLRHGRYLADHIPGARLVEIPLQDHLPYPAAAPRLVEEIQDFLTGERPAPEPDRVLTTLLFTDVVESTRRAAELRDRRWRGVLERYHAIAREQVRRFRGREVNRAGDGRVERFDGAARAVECARAIVSAAGAHDIAVRAGVHTGEAELVGDDVAGIAVHIGARIGALASGGQVLVSSTVKDLVVGSSLEFTDLGEHELRGVPGRWRLFESVG